MRLSELNPKWMTLGGAGDDIVGLTFRCPHCPPGERGETTFLGVMFRAPIDPDQHPDIDWPDYMAKHAEEHFWARTGDSFETLTLSPSIDVSGAGHWHGFIENGLVRNA